MKPYQTLIIFQGLTICLMSLYHTSAIYLAGILVREWTQQCCAVWRGEERRAREVGKQDEGVE